MARKPVFGKCHICGEHKKLSFEHVPPKSAFNDRSVVLGKIKDMMANVGSATPKGKTLQRGIGYYTLCDSCNNSTGAWYGKAFADWAWQGLRIMDMTKGSTHILHLPLHIYPLRVAKQILCMFCSVNTPEFCSKNKELQRFLLNKEHKYLPKDLRIFISYNLSNYMRYTGVSATIKLDNDMLNIGRWKTEKMTAFSEITFPPFIYVLSVDNTIPDEKLYEITHFGNYKYNDWKTFHLNFPVLPVETWFPGDYRKIKASN